MLVYVAAARLSVTCGACPPFHRNWDNSETTQQKHYYMGATFCHAISVHVINLPMHLYCITYWLADNLGTLFLRWDSASSSTATLSTSASTTPALKRFKFMSEKLQQSGSADVRWPESEQQFQHLCHDACANRSIPSGTSGRGRCLYLLEETTGSLFTPCPTCIRPNGSTCITGLRATGLLCVCRWLTAGHRNRLSKNLEIRVFLKMNRLGVNLT